MVDIKGKNNKRRIRKLSSTLLITLLSLQVPVVNSETLAQTSKSHEVIVALTNGVIKEIALFKTDPCLQPDDFHRYPNKKHFLSLNIFCRALKAANYKFTIKIIPIPNIARGKWLLNEGKAHVLSHLLQRKIIDNIDVDGIVHTDVVRNDYSRLSAFFTSVNNHSALAANSLADIQKLKAVVPHKWVWQKKQLDQLKIIYHPLKYENIAKFIDSQRADIVLLDMIGKNPTEKILFGVTLKATGKIYFVGRKAERFTLSKNIKGADELISALSIGLKKLKTSGIIDEVFAGLTLDTGKLNGWKMLSRNPKN